MPLFHRAQVDLLIERLLEPPQTLIAIFGPRQTGKTTAVRQALASIEVKSQYVSMEPAYDAASPMLPPPNTGSSPSDSMTWGPSASQPNEQRLMQIWEQARHEARKSPGGFVLVLDEIQKINQWAGLVKGHWDRDRMENLPLHVVILGSAPLLMQSGLNESLAGRFEPLRFSHWSFSEMSEAFDFNLDEYIYFGGYPGTASRIADSHRWGEYVRSALIGPLIERDVLSMVRVDKPELLKRLFEVGARHSGQVVSYNKMLGHLQEAGNTTTLTRYLSLLDQVGMLAGLPKLTNRPLNPKRPTPKLNVLNSALMSATSGLDFDEARADRSFWGHLVESSVGAHLLNSSSTRTKVKHWRDGNYEVDFVLERGPHLIGIEVKSGNSPSKTHGMTEFERRFSPTKCILVGDAGIPLHQFLSLPAEHWFDTL
ncbi:ATP-binding protein [Candidatus Poriferisocius sp.]|uniref:ATP-binding protein n=1 Tax=Candidatus Poriferisocius sp. TaxID=3101276 RepID=UPI003B01D1E6